MLWYQEMRYTLYFSLSTEDFSAANWLRLIEMLESDRMFVFSTDYPHWDFDAPEESIPRDLPADLRSRILYDNARELYGLEEA